MRADFPERPIEGRRSSGAPSHTKTGVRAFPQTPALLISSKSIDCNDLFFIVRAARLAYSVRHHKSTALTALHQIRSAHLPVRSSLISSSLGRFILWTNRHRLHLLYAFSLQFVNLRSRINATRIIHTLYIIHIACGNVKQFFLQFPPISTEIRTRFS